MPASALFDMFDLVSKKGWVHGTELMVALRRRAAGLPALESECFCGYPVEPGWDHSACHTGMEIA